MNNELNSATKPQAEIASDLKTLLTKLHARWGDCLWIDAGELMALEKAADHFSAPPSPQPVAESVPVLTVWYGAMPESNGKSNFTATLMRKGASLMDTNHYTFARSEYPERVRYEADSMRYLIGEIDNEPCCLDYDDKKHSGYVEPAAALQPVARQDEAGGVTVYVFDSPDCEPVIEACTLPHGRHTLTATTAIEPVAGLTDADIERFATEIGMSRTGYTMDPQYFYRMFARAIERHLTGNAGDQKGGAA